MVAKKKKSNKARKSSSMKVKPAPKVPSSQKAVNKVTPKSPNSITTNLYASIRSPPQPAATVSRPVFSIEIGSIGGETTIGDLIVAFPRTRDVLMKHGLRFDVEEAGYLYMTLNVFSAIHGLTPNALVQELHTASKEPPPQPVVQPFRPIVTAPPA